MIALFLLVDLSKLIYASALQEFIFQQIIYGMLLQHNTSDYNEALLSSYRHH